MSGVLWTRCLEVQKRDGASVSVIKVVAYLSGATQAPFPADELAKGMAGETYKHKPDELRPYNVGA